MTQVVINTRFEGIPGVSLGGYVAGLAAKSLGPSVAVSLTRAVPPGATVIVGESEMGRVLKVDDVVAATAVVDAFQSTAPIAITPDEAERASEAYPGFTHHFFPRCFTCGPARSVGEGLRIFPGPVDGRRVVATLWHPPPIARQSDGSVASEFLWAALDCPAIWGHVVYGESEGDDRGVTGRLALHQHAPVPGDRASIVLGWPIERQGRKVIAGAAIYADAGELLVEALQTMILTNRGVPLHLSAWTGSR